MKRVTTAALALALAVALPAAAAHEIVNECHSTTTTRCTTGEADHDYNWEATIAVIIGAAGVFSLWRVALVTMPLPSTRPPAQRRIRAAK